MNRQNLFSQFNLAPDGWLWQSLLAFVSALLLLLAFPGVSLTYLGWIALAPLLYVVTRGISLRRGFWLGWLVGLVFTFFAENWITHSMTRYGGLPAIAAYGVAFLFASVLALFPALFGLVVTRLVNVVGWPGLTLAPVVWAATEFLRPFVTGVTWNALGISQVEHFRIAQLARFGGVYLISAELVAASALLVLLPKFKERAVGRAAALLVFGAAGVFLLADAQRDSSPATPTQFTAIGVQPNLSPDTDQSSEAAARDLENNLKLTREALARAPRQTAELVIWAESPLVLFYETDAAVRDKLNQFASETGAHLVVNTVTRDDWRYTNSVHVISPESGVNLRRYDKMRLVPFGEYVPWRPLLGWFVPPMIGDFTPGREAVVNTLRLTAKRETVITPEASKTGIERTTNFVRLGSFICYEAAYPDLVRQFVRNGATVLINVSNDAWFGNTAGAQQHLQHARMRAIENNRDLLRVTNSGISALITADGQVVDALPSFTAAAQVWQAQSRRPQTFYTQRGDWFAIGCVLVSALALGLSYLRNVFTSQTSSQGTAKSR